MTNARAAVTSPQLMTAFHNTRTNIKITQNEPIGRAEGLDWQ